MYESLSSDCSRFKSIIRRMEESGVACGLIGGNMDWKMVVVKASRRFGTFESSVAFGELKLFMTSRGGVR